MEKLSRSIVINVSVTICQIPFILIAGLVFLKLSDWLVALIVGLAVFSSIRSIWKSLKYKKKLRQDLADGRFIQRILQIQENFPGRNGHYILDRDQKFFLPGRLLYRQKIEKDRKVQISYLPISKTVIRFNQNSVLVSDVSSLLSVFCC